MNLQEFQKRTEQTDNIDLTRPRGSSVLSFGVLGEFGSFLSEIKKSARDGDMYIGYQENVLEELGDMLWYIARLASTHNIQLLEVGNDYTPEVNHSTSEDSHLFVLSTAVNELVTALQKGDTEPKKLFETVICAINTVCKIEKFDLGDVLTRNIEKTRDIWGHEHSSPAPQHNSDLPEHEQLPRQLTVEFIEIIRGQSTEVIQRVGGIAVGDRLTDNAYDPDGYRYHDAFHLGYAASLGWSPVVRRMLRAKRKTDGRIDEVEDGARAAIIEEAIASLVFNYAREHSWLQGINRIDHNLLKQIRQMVKGLEVANCLYWEWQQAIFNGFAAFRQLRENHGGWLVLDASKRTLSYSQTSP